MTTGYGENQTRVRFNAKWGLNGHCFRIPQRYGDPPAIADLVAGISGDRTYSIEIKRITNQKRGSGYTMRPLEFNRHFSISTNPNVEFPHQLERQVRLSRRLGWHPVLLLQCVTPYVGSNEFLFNSTDLLQIMLDGKKSLPSKLFPEMHRPKLYEHLFKSRPRVRKSRREDD